MRVLHIGKYFPPYAGGMETYLRDLMTAQKKQGIDTTALVHQSDITLNSQDEIYTVSKQRLPITRAAVWARLLFTPISPTFPWLLNRMIKARQPDILHLHMPNVSAFWALFSPRARRIPWVVHWHADVLASSHHPGLRIFYTLYRPFERAILQRSKAVIVTSPPYLASSLPLHGYHGKCHTVPLGLDPSRFPVPVQAPSPSPSPTTKDNNTPLKVLAIGRLTYYKGFEYLIRATAQAENIKVHLVGKGDQEGRLKALARELRLGNRITFHDHLSDAQLAHEFGACDCLCLPSIERTEAFGMVLLEAMYYGKATVISDVPGSGMGWVVDGGVTGLKAPPEGVDELAWALQSLHQDREKMRTLGEQGRKKFDLLFHIDQSARNVARLYTDVLNKRRSDV